MHEKFIKEEIEEIKKIVRDAVNEVVREVMKDLRGVGFEIRLSKEELEEAEPTSAVLRDIAEVIKESIRKGLRERGEVAIDQMIAKMPEDKAELIIKSLANEDRIKILKLLYFKSRSFSELKDELKLESSSLAYNLRQLLSTGLIFHDESISKYKISNRGRTLLRILALIYETLGGEVNE